MGIPSRAIIGYAVTSNESLRPQASSQDILHAYPEYLDTERKIWLAVDPTWGHTTGGSEYFDRLDFGHLTFVRLGADSSYPLPAGSYRDSDTPKQIKVEVKSDAPPTQAEPSYTLTKVDEHEVLINTGTQAIVQTNLKLDGRDLFIPYLPPLGRLPLTSVKSSPNPTYLLIAALSLLLIIAAIFYLKRWYKKPKG